MDNLNLTVNVNNLTAEERETLLRLVEKGRQAGSKIWKPKHGDQYYCIGRAGALYDFYWNDGDAGDDFDRDCWDIGNVFRTEEEAQEELTRRKMLTRWKRMSIEAGEDDNPWDGNGHHWFAKYDHVHGIIGIAWVDTRSHGCVYFPTQASLLHAINELGEDNVKKYILGC